MTFESIVNDNEKLYRSLKEDQIKDGRISKSAFRNNKSGISCNAAKNRCNLLIKRQLIKQFLNIDKHVHSCVLSISDIRNLAKAYPFYVPEKHNKYHSEIWESETDRKQSVLRKAIELSKIAKLYFEYPSKR